MIRLFTPRSTAFFAAAGALFAVFLLLPGQIFAAELAASGLIPAQMELPSPWGVLKVLLLATFWLHLLLVNIVIGSVVLSTVKAWRTPQGGNFPLQREITLVPGILALTVNFGVAPFLFAQVTYGSFLYSSSVIMAVWWISVPLLIMFAYYALYLAKAGQPASLSGQRFFLSTLTLLLCMVAFFLTNNSSLMLRPDYWFDWFAKPGGRLLNWSDPTLVPRYLHMITASIAIGGLFMAARARWNIWRNSVSLNLDEENAAIQRGLRWFVLASLVQAAIGIWFLFALPGGVRNLFLGADLLSTAALVLAVLGLIGALLMARAQLVGYAATFTALTVFIMVGVRDLVRDAMLAPFLSSGQAGTPVFGQMAPELALPIAKGQMGALAFFLICTVLGVACTIWVVRVSMRAFDTSPQAAQPANNATNGLGE